jgi:hypothetical protein
MAQWRHPGTWVHGGVTWLAVRAMPDYVRQHWPIDAPAKAPGRSTTYGLAQRDIVTTVENPTESRSWWGYAGEPVTAATSFMVDVLRYATAVVTSKQAQAEIARTHLNTSSTTTIDALAHAPLPPGTPRTD